MGEGYPPIPESLSLMESLCHGYLHNIVYESGYVAQRRGGGLGLDSDCFLEVARRLDPSSMERIEQLLATDVEIQEMCTINLDPAFIPDPSSSSEYSSSEEEEEEEEED